MEELDDDLGELDEDMEGEVNPVAISEDEDEDEDEEEDDEPEEDDELEEDDE